MEFVLMIYQGTTPRHVQDRQLEVFATKIMPEFR